MYGSAKVRMVRGDGSHYTTTPFGARKRERRAQAKRRRRFLAKQRAR